MDLNYQIVRSAKRKKLTITVERDRSIVVHAPVGATDEAIRAVVDIKRHWLFEKVNHSQKYQDRPHAPGKEVVNGESVPYLGREYRMEIGETASGGVEFSRRFVVPAARLEKRREVLKEWYILRREEPDPVGSTFDFQPLLFQNHDGGMNSGFDGEMGVVQNGSTVGDHEGGVDALAVRRIPLGYGIHFPHVGAAGGADLFVGIDVDFVGRVWKDHGADVPAFHDDAGVIEVSALEADEFFPHFRDGGDGGDVGIDGLAAECIGGINAINGDGGFVGSFPAVDLDAIKHGDDCRIIRWIDFFLKRLPGDGAIHGSRIHHDEAEVPGEFAGESAFSRSGRTIDGDGEAGLIGDG
jgi:hypothetical protein